MSRDSTIQTKPCEKVQIAMCDARDYIIRHSTFKHEDKAEMLLYLAEGIDDPNVGDIRITKWKKNGEKIKHREMVGRW